MNKIHLLDEKTINKISAGEVVERPASIVKELIENSIDAGSKNITVEILEGGIPYIKVSDDGCGMNEIDAILAFERHATSKIKSDNDLYSIGTLGFRGEALASIAAVSHVTLQTKEEGALFGTKVVVEGGKVVEKTTCGCAKGCSIEVRDVFFNTPARRKFLKRPSTESMYITDVVTKLCLSHPEVSFKYVKDRKLQFITSGNGNIEDVILRLFGNEVYSSLMSASFESEDLKLKILAGKNSLNYSNRNMQFFYVNGRYVKNKTLSAAVDEAFKTYIPVNRYPAVFLYMEIDPRQIDVNIHPSKLEIKFSDERRIFEAVYKTIKDSLHKYNLIPEVKIEEKKNIFEIETPTISAEQTKLYFTSSDKEVEKEKKKFDNEFKGKNVFLKDNVLKENSKNSSLDNHLAVYEEYEHEKEEINKNDLAKKISDIRIVGTLFSTYIIVEKEDVFYIIDQHAAHERILYEKFTSQYEKIQTRQVTFPIVVELQPRDLELVHQEKELLNKLGYVFEEFGNNSIILREVPVILGQPEARQLFIDIVEKLKDKELVNKISLKEENIIMMACKAAVKAMDNLSEKEINKLFDDLKITENPYTCPHGRPVIIAITKTQLEKMFKRIM
ncbi:MULTISPECIES: DNA mismatch repair endonuclease MutL [Thermoanaerobacter]|jgi:DNA mismatch repair protein MutL|uniref:DNA mismatch repair protein MutL n=2 Tax=Thermoanaerobacter TaxID=1754 RepID=MUTL_THEP3|nr:MULTISPECIES: DNA mismatch repair endonuclease MutL [Thermoanaerobacter]B0K9L6.1 RecName: Full=DNA mismatch repair protein MutL [Thermoanaerobacter pseudethanolicus ATCC 33223]ABY94829.1 DNA mismatch repair protein MutL [Thermoanaerobacter pseudethanolicus ATCC 33223]ADV79778.1 DNA mismatch repair protein MutL [Thermoanaerobacter brockii subsp. finnii Ako-1]HBW58807.1 DNA mismatch repair protein MutL [Thermoanaerobacter sp.]